MRYDAVMTRFQSMFGVGWAQPVVSRPWAFAASVAFAFSRATGYRLGNHAKHRAWQHACGIA